MNILLTGNSGFLGRYVSDELSAAGHTIVRIGRRTGDAAILCDLSKQVPTLPGILFDKVIHVAGQAHRYPKNREEEQDMYSANVQMANNLVQALEQSTIPPRQFVFISSVAVYGCDKGSAIKEDFPTHPVSAYGKAKLNTEEMLRNWGNRTKVNVLILRLPLVAGGDPPGNLGHMIKAIRKGVYIRMRNNIAKKSMVLAADVARLINTTDTGRSGIYHLTDRYHPSIMQVEQAIEENLKTKVRISLPYSILAFFSKAGDLMERMLKKDMPLNSAKLGKLTSELTFNDDKAVADLGWTPTRVVDFLRQV